jgi:uncharacterized membrane protein
MSLTSGSTDPTMDPMTDVIPAAETDHRDVPVRRDSRVREPVHPRWIHAPLGGVFFVAVFDVLSAAAGSTRPWAHDLYRSGTFVLSAVPPLLAVAIGTGLLDRARATADHTPIRARVNLHAAVMVTMALASAGDLALRRLVYADAQHAPAAVLAVTIVAVAAALVGGDVGGRLTYRAGVGVRPRPSRRSDGGDPG